MKRFKLVKDTPFHTVGTVLEESDMSSFYNYVKMSEGEANSVINFWSFFEEVKELRFTIETLPILFMFEGCIFDDNNEKYYNCYDDSSDWYRGNISSTIPEYDLLNQVINSVSKVYSIIPSKR